MNTVQRIGLSLTLCLLAGCESDERKLERLEHDYYMAVLDVVGAKQRVAGHGDTSRWADSLRVRERRLELAARAKTMFMNGR